MCQITWLKMKLFIPSDQTKQFDSCNGIAIGCPCNPCCMGKSSSPQDMQIALPIVDGWNPAPVEVGSFSHYLQGFMPPRWCRISAINSISEINEVENWKTWSLRMGRGGHHVSTAVSVDTIGTTGTTPSCPKGKSLDENVVVFFLNISWAGPWVNLWQSYDDILWWVFMNFIPKTSNHLPLLWFVLLFEVYAGLVTTLSTNKDQLEPCTERCGMVWLRVYMVKKMSVCGKMQRSGMM